MTQTAPTALFRYNDDAHVYVDLLTGEELPHITGMLKAAGLADDRWFTEESSERGTEVHRLTRDYDLQALDPATCVSAFRGYLLAHVKAIGVIQPKWEGIEVALVHPQYRFGGRVDRLGIFYRTAGVMELKTGVVTKAHQIQTAMQAILAAPRFGLPAEMLTRYVLYVKDKGKFKLERHEDRRDFDLARVIIRNHT